MSGAAQVVVIVPVLRRPHRVAPLIASLEAATPQPHRLLFVASPGDEAELEAISSAGADVLVLDQDPAPGDYQRKINAAAAATDEPLLFIGADDVHFHPGWLHAATAVLAGGVGVVGTNDLGNPRVLRGEHATHSLVTRRYVEVFGTIDEPGKVLHEGYPHEFCDDELVGTAKHRGAWAFAFDSVVEHLHPHWGKSDTDALYDAHAARMNVGRRIYRKRCRLWT